MEKEKDLKVVENGSKETDHKHEQAAGRDHLLKLKVKCNKDGKETYFLIKRNIKIRRVLRRFCEHASLDYRSTRFVFDHRWFSHDKTPNQLGFNDGDQIEAFIDANGA